MKFLSMWLPLILWMLIIFLLSSRHSVSVSSEYIYNFLFFKTLHVIEYAILYVLWLRALRSSLRNSQIHVTALAFVLTTLYAMTDELHQTMVPSREGKLRDVIIDAAGALMAWITIEKLFPKAPKRLRNWAVKQQIL